MITHRVRATGLIVPAHAVTLQVPQLQQQFAQLTLEFIAPSGIHVRQGQRVAAFDRTQLADAAADAEAQYRALGSQVREMEAKNAAEAAQRAVTLRKALADEGHARLELEKRPVLTGLEIAKDQVQLADARAHVRSLRQAGQWLTREAAAKLRALRLQRDEQKALWQRAGRDSRRMVLRAPMSGMLALALPPFMGQAVPGAKLYSGMPLLRIFDPSRMQVRAQISELDLTWMSPGAPAQVRIDAYPGLLLPAHLLRLNPIAVSSLGTPIHNFTATFSLDRGDPRALPDLNASVEITSAPRAGWLVPRSAVHYQNGQAFVWGRGARARRRRPVQVVAFGRRWIEIRAPWLGPGPNQRARAPARLLP
ncbi:MAG: efflux RND transporter periplasmic adaptor subunit, partial [Terriglobales bacterium]